MQKTEHNQTASSTRRKVQVSTTLNRKYVKRPGQEMATVKKKSTSKKMDDNAVEVSVSRSSRIKRFNESMMEETGLYAGEMQENVTMQDSSSQVTGGQSWMQEQNMTAVQEEQEMQAPEAHPLQVSANERVRQRKISVVDSTAKTMSAKELKDQAIKKALAQASQSVEPATTRSSGKMAKAAKKSQSKKSRSQNFGKVRFGFGRVMLALSCAAVAVLAIVYFVNLNMPDLSLKVAAMQTGIQASYPNYIPRDYKLSDITAEDGKVVLNFRNSGINGAYTIVEERSSWDSNALLTNYVDSNYGDDYTVLREQGLTIYVDGSNATWVNGGVLFKLVTTSGTLSKKQITSIATSL